MTKHLPVLSSAAATTFCAAKVEGPDGVYLWVDGNDKITAGNGAYGAPKPNAFSLLQVDDCPGSTPTCRASCYVHGLEKHAKDTHDLYRHNSETIRVIIDSPHAIAWAEIFADWITENAAGGFRWHVSGDLFSAEYAAWVAAVVERSPAVRHWIYTRSHELTAVFVGLANLTVNYSVDRDNYHGALPYVKAHEGVGSPVRLCYLVTQDGEYPRDLPDGSVLFPDYALRGACDASPAEARATSDWYQSLGSRERRMVCPVDFYGKAKNRRCGPCRKCIDAPE